MLGKLLRSFDSMIGFPKIIGLDSPFDFSNQFLKSWDFDYG